MYLVLGARSPNLIKLGQLSSICLVVSGQGREGAVDFKTLSYEEPFLFLTFCCKANQNIF